jgi:glucose/arabinose dehydrogenase
MRRLTSLLATAFVLVVTLVIVVGPASGRSSALRLETVVTGLDTPLFVTEPAGEFGHLYVVQQGGLIRVVENGKIRAAPFLDLTQKTKKDGERGLLGLAFAPDYATSRLFVVDYTDNDGNTRVVRYKSDGERGIPSSARQLLFVRQPYPNHNGGMVAYGRDGLLYVGMGDGGAGGDPQDRAQNPNVLLGKILRLDPRTPGAKPTIVALGVRNPWRFSFDRATGDLMVGDVGQESIEEIDWVRWPWHGLLNFGWNHYEGHSTFNKSKVLGPGRLVRPVTQYSHDHGCSVTGGYVYRGVKVPAAKGRYFYGDYCEGSIWSLRMSGGKATQLRTEPFTVKNLDSFGEDASGELYVVSGDGTIYRLAS